MIRFLVSFVIGLTACCSGLAQETDSDRDKRRGAVNQNAIVKRDLAYVENGHERHRLDLYLADVASRAGSTMPLVVWIHGGGWRNGSKQRTPAIALLDRGFAVASINYRLSGHATFPAQIHDCKAAIRWLRANASEYGIDPQRIGVWGSSAGGHLSALVGTSGDVDSLEGTLGNLEKSSRVQAVCDWFGPTDLLRMNEQAGKLGKMDHDSPRSPESLLLGGPLQEMVQAAGKASPLTYVTKDDPPFLIVHGDKDPLVAWQQSQLLHDALTSAGCKSDLVIVPGAGHGRFQDAGVMERCLQFFADELGNQENNGTERGSDQ